MAWTYRTLLEQGRPSFRIQMADVKDVVVEGPRRVVFHFKSNDNRELPLILGGLPVLPKHFFDGRDFSEAADRSADRLRPVPHRQLRARSQRHL